MVLNIFQSRFKIWPNTKLTLENCQRLLTFHHSGEILVTLPRVENFYIEWVVKYLKNNFKFLRSKKIIGSADPVRTRDVIFQKIQIRQIT